MFQKKHHHINEIEDNHDIKIRTAASSQHVNKKEYGKIKENTRRS